MTRAVRLLAAITLVAQGLSPAFAADKVPAAGGAIEITPLIHSSIQLEYGGKVIQVDPWSALDLSRYKKADLILITDGLPALISTKFSTDKPFVIDC